LRGNTKSSTIPTLIISNVKYENDQQKADLFISYLKETFSTTNDQNFDKRFNENEFLMKNEN
jgi:ribosome-binding factor A